jgi:hypothetical protein
MICSIDYTNYLTRKDFGGNFEKHLHPSFRDQIHNQLGTTIEDCAKH